jgi:hypothetical protein
MQDSVLQSRAARTGGMQESVLHRVTFSLLKKSPKRKQGLPPL